MSDINVIGEGQSNRSAILKIENIKPNKYYADILGFDYAGYISETTSIMQYTYQGYVLKHVDADVAHALKGIALDETRHHAMLGELIVSLGGDPIIANSRRQFWSGQFVDYMKGIRRIVLFDIESEMKSIQSYKKAISMISDENVNEILERIVADEKEHIEILEGILQKNAY